jgi:hypothetical protein
MGLLHWYSGSTGFVGVSSHTQMDVCWPPDSESRVDYELLFLAFGCFVHKNTRLSGGTGNGIDPVTHYTS